MRRGWRGLAHTFVGVWLLASGACDHNPVDVPPAEEGGESGLGASGAAEDGSAPDQDSAPDPSAQVGAQSASMLRIGVNGIADQFPYLDAFLKVSTGPAGPRLCHVYLSWTIADEPPPNGATPMQSGTRAFFEDWLRQAEGHCDEAMITFKALAPASVPTETEFARAFGKFIDTPWGTISGFKGTMVFTPWNEPNPAGDGSGLGRAVPPEVAAAYFLSAERLCATRGCTVVAGDFASNGNMWDDYRLNCADDDGDPRTLCTTPSEYNTTKLPPSYLDRYKNTIANRARDFGLPASYRPKYFAFHGWHDINRYLNDGDRCATYESCLTRRVLASLGRSWRDVEIWDNEVGVGQFSPGFGDAEQACGAAFLIRLTTISPRITRLYYTRFRRGPGELFVNAGTPRPAMEIIAKRERAALGFTCR